MRRWDSIVSIVGSKSFPNYELEEDFDWILEGGR